MPGKAQQYRSLPHRKLGTLQPREQKSPVDPSHHPGGRRRLHPGRTLRSAERRRHAPRLRRVLSKTRGRPSPVVVHAVGLSATGDLTNGTKYTRRRSQRRSNVRRRGLPEGQERVRSVSTSNITRGCSPSLIGLAPLAITVTILFFILRAAQSGGSQALSFGRSRAKMLSENRPEVTFADVQRALTKPKKSWPKSSTS